jgi:hypothetical protein
MDLSAKTKKNKLVVTLVCAFIILHTEFSSKNENLNRIKETSVRKILQTSLLFQKFSIFSRNKNLPPFPSLFSGSPMPRLPVCEYANTDVQRSSCFIRTVPVLCLHLPAAVSVRFVSLVLWVMLYSPGDVTGGLQSRPSKEIPSSSGSAEPLVVRQVIAPPRELPRPLKAASRNTDCRDVGNI